MQSGIASRHGESLGTILNHYHYRDVVGQSAKLENINTREGIKTIPCQTRKGESMSEEDDYDDEYDQYQMEDDWEREREENDPDAHIRWLENDNDFILFGIFSGFFNWLFGGK
jgi:Ni/Co efflux regulator RcnB